MYQGKPLQAFHVRRWLGIFATKVQVEQLTPHRLRHSYATRLINTGQIPITTLQKLMGHRRLDTTMQYVALYNEKVIHDYQSAMATSQAETDLNWNVWGPTVEAIFQHPAPMAASSLIP
jgi:integrase